MNLGVVSLPVGVEGIPLGSCRNLARYRPARRDPALNFKTGKIEPLNVITQVGSGDEMHNPGDGRFYVTPATLGISGLAIGAASPVATGVGLLVRQGGGCKTTSIPFLIKGTSSDPKFVPGVVGAGFEHAQIPTRLCSWSNT